MNCAIAGLLVLLAAAVSAEEGVVDAGLVVKDVTREIDVTSQLVKETLNFVLENTGSSSINSFLVSIHSKQAPHVSWISADFSNKQLKVSQVSSVRGMKSEDKFYKIQLKDALGAGKTAKVDVEIVSSHILQPFPTHITQAQQQHVVLEGNVHVLSPYRILKEKTVVKMAPGSLESHTKAQPTKHEGDTITYGPYENTPAFSFKEMKIHFENNAPFLSVATLDRVVELSNWGNIAVEETLEVVHNGAKLKGSFSRFDYQRDRRDKMPSVQSFKTVLPAAARDVYYRDEIGNISTSNLRINEDSVEMEIRPRFPLFGGWKTNYYIGYNVPSFEYLYVDGNKYVLKMRFVDHIFDNFVVDKMSLKVILPEGAKDIVLKAPFDVDMGQDQKHYTYLDVEGRPVKLARKSNLVESHIQDFELHYTFDRMAMIREPLMIIVSFYLLFLVVIIWVRLDFTIAQDPQSEARLKVGGLIEELADQHSSRLQNYDSWSEAVSKYKTSKDNATLTGVRKKVEAGLKTISQQMTDIQAKLKAENPEIAEKVSEIQRLDRTAREHLNTLHLAAERLVGGKIQKAAYADTEKTQLAKFSEARDKMESLVFSL